jgi:hypothetical protein
MGSGASTIDHSRSLDVGTVLKESVDQEAREEVNKEETIILTDDDLRAATIDGTVPTVIVDSGASSTCVKPADQQMQTSECGEYTWQGPPFTATGEDSNKLFSMALGHRAPRDEVVDLHLSLRRKSRRGHTVRGITNSLQSLNSAVLDGYIPIFDGKHVNFYDSRNTKITVSRVAVLKGYYVPHEGLWRIPLVYNERPVKNETTETIAWSKSPIEILQASPPPSTKHINSAYELKAQPELIRYLHAAAGFPTLPTWLAAIKNDHYKS